MDSFNKFFENSNEEIVIEENEELEDNVEIEVDDSIYEIDVYNNLVGDLPLHMQNNPKIQDEYMKLTRHIINLKNTAMKVDLDDIEDYPDMKKIYNTEFGVSWIFPIVLDKKKIYKKLDINTDNSDDVMEQYIDTASNRGMQYEDFVEELKKELQYIDEFQRDKLSYPNYKKLIYDIEAPYIIKKELKKKDVGYQLYLNNYAKLLRYFNIDNKFWQIYEGFGPDKFTYDQYDDTGKRVGSRTAQILSGEYINIIGFLVLGSNQKNILDALNGEPWFDRIRMIGEATKIRKNDKAIIELKNHGLKNGDKVMITDSNSEPSVNGEYLNIKVINENEFMVPVKIASDGKEGTYAKIYTTTVLKFEKKIVENYGENAYLYLFPEEEIKDTEWKSIVKKVVPDAQKIINSKMTLLEDATTIDEMNNILESFSIEFKKLGYENYFKLSEILESDYIKQKDKQSKFDYDVFYGEIIKMRDTIKGENRELKVKDDILFGDKYIFNSEIIKYYGRYPNAGTDVDSVGSRFNWLINTPDHGKLFFLLLELEKVREYKEGKIDITERVKEVKKILLETERELKVISNTKKCEDRKINPVKIYESFNELAKDVGKITNFNEGDYAIIENDKSHENGMIYVWNGMNWVQNKLIQNIEDLCLLGVEKIKDFDIDKLHCLFRNACRNKKTVRLENKKIKLENELEIYNDLSEDKPAELEKSLKEKIYMAELKLQIYLREIESTKKEETIEVYEQDIDPVYLEISKIPDLQQKEYLRNLLIKKDGITIDKDIFSIRTGKKICCGHYYYQLKIAGGTNPVYSERVTEEMLAVFGSEEQNGVIYCNHCGRPLMLMEYDTAEGLSKTTGEISKQRQLVKSEIQELKEEIEGEEVAEKEIELYECSDTQLRNELKKLGIDVDKVSKPKDICNKLNSLNIKTGILLKKKDFINIIVDVIQKMQRLPDVKKFKQIELIKMKQKGIDLKKITPQMIIDRYNDLLLIKKTTLTAARLLIQYQTIIPPQYPSGRRSSVVFEGFEGDRGREYMALLIEESKMLPIKKGLKIMKYLELGKIKEEVRRSYDDMSDLNSVKQLKRDRKIYESKQILKEEGQAQILVKNIPEFPKLKDNYQKEVEKAKLYKQFQDYQKILYERQAYIGREIVRTINDVVGKAADMDRDNPKSKELSCCYEPIGEDTDYYKYLEDKTSINIKEILEESRKNGYYYSLFLNGGILMKHYPKRKPYIDITTENKGYNKEEVRKYLFMTYINSGIFKGEKHEYNEEGICLLTGEKKANILKKDYGEEQERSLIKAIIEKTARKLVLGGSEKDVEEMIERDKGLIDNMDINSLKEETSKGLFKEINSFVDKIGKFMNKSKNREFLANLREKIDTLGRFNSDRLESEERKDIVDYDNNILRNKIMNLKRYINNYFRRYLSMIQNRFDPTEHIQRLEEMDESTSKDLQKYIYEREYFLKKYLTKKDSELFGKLKFDMSSKIVSNICAEADKWNNDYTKVIKVINFNLSNLSEALLYVLISNLDRFISYDFGKGGMENNKIVAQFVMDVFNKIFDDNSNLDYREDTFLPGDYRTKEVVKEGEEDIKSDTIRMIDELGYKFKKVRDQTDYEEVYGELAADDKKLSAKENFLKEYKDKFGQDPTDNEIIDFMEEREKESKLDEDIENEEYMMEKDVDEDALDVGEGYGEMPQGGEGEEGDY